MTDINLTVLENKINNLSEEFVLTPIISIPIESILTHLGAIDALRMKINNIQIFGYFETGKIKHILQNTSLDLKFHP